MNAKQKIVAAYCRAGCANPEQIARQKKILKELAKKRGLRVGRFYIDDGYSGMTLDRPAFAQLLRDCKARKVGTVLVTDTDRIARNVCLVAEGLHAFGRYRTQVVIDNLEGLKFFRTMMSAVLELQSTNQS